MERQNICVNDSESVIDTEHMPQVEEGHINDEQQLEMGGKEITVVYMVVYPWMLPMPWTFLPLPPQHLEHQDKKGGEGHVQRGVILNNVHVIAVIGIECVRKRSWRICIVDFSKFVHTLGCFGYSKQYCKLHK